jgi:transposase-like protein
MKKIEKEKAIILRESGKSLSEISEELGVSKSTVSLWTKNVVLDGRATMIIEDKARMSRAKGHATLHKKKLNRLNVAEKEATKLLEKIKFDENTAIIALSIMYWCEGIKDDNGVAFTNSDPELVRAFISMLEKIFEIDRKKFTVCLHIHDYHNESDSLNFWSQAIGIPLNQFTKTYKKKSNHKYSHKGYKGCVRISYFNSHISRTILSFAKNFIKLYI